MFVLGLTGSIGMGKSTAADMLRRLGVPVHDADAAVHRLLAADPIVRAEIAARFPSAMDGDEIDRQALGAAVFSDPAARSALETILHPRVRAAAKRFLRKQALARAPLVVLDIPLLYETGGEVDVDAVMVVSAPEFLQARRVLSRPGMSVERFRGILASQISDGEKRWRADYVIETGLGKAYTYRRLQQLVGALSRQRRRPAGYAHS
ncbi:MAG: dephospho-CoA kinase [Alphaproteobacteria bacterium]|nr:dephospho-CoA kinase [Alphaproteobacteria bacterium]